MWHLWTQFHSKKPRFYFCAGGWSVADVLLRRLRRPWDWLGRCHGATVPPWPERLPSAATFHIAGRYAYGCSAEQPVQRTFVEPMHELDLRLFRESGFKSSQVLGPTPSTQDLQTSVSRLVCDSACTWEFGWRTSFATPAGPATSPFRAKVSARRIRRGRSRQHCMSVSTALSTAWNEERGRIPTKAAPSLCLEVKQRAGQGSRLHLALQVAFITSGGVCGVTDREA